MRFTEIRTVSAEGKPLYARLAGSGPALLVLLHGFPEDNGLWRQVAPILAPQMQLLLVDLPGAGQSTLPAAPLTVALMADAVARLLNAAGTYEKTVIAGHSMGGYVALAFAEKYAGRLRGLSLMHSTAGADNEEKKDARRKVIRLLRHGGKEAFIKEMVPALFAPGFRKANPALIAEQQENARRLPAESMISFYDAMIHRPDQTALSGSLALPVQYHLGGQDTVIPMESVLPQTLLPNVSFVEVYPDAAHMSMLEAPNLLAQNLASFVDYC